MNVPSISIYKNNGQHCMLPVTLKKPPKFFKMFEKVAVN